MSRRGELLVILCKDYLTLSDDEQLTNELGRVPDVPFTSDQTLQSMERFSLCQCSWAFPEGHRMATIVRPPGLALQLASYLPIAED